MQKYHYLNEIIKYMKETRATQAEFARVAGVSRFTINNILRRKIKPKKDADKLDLFFDEHYKVKHENT